MTCSVRGSQLDPNEKGHRSRRHPAKEHEVRRGQKGDWSRQEGMEHMPGAAAGRRGTGLREHVLPREPGCAGPAAELRIVPSGSYEIQLVQWSPWQTEVEP